MDEWKEHLHDLIRSMHEGNMEETNERISHMIGWMQEGVERGYFQLTHTQGKEEDKEEAPSAEPTMDEALNSSTLVLDESYDTDDDQETLYPFNRRLRGGYLQELNAFVPEKFVRIFDVTENDLIRATPVREEEDRMNGGTRVIYDYELVKRQEGNGDSNRIQHDYVMVQLAYNELHIVDPQTQEPIYFENTNKPIVIERHKIQDDPQDWDGILVSVAYYSNNPGTVQIIWRHSSSSDMLPTPQKKVVLPGTVGRQHQGTKRRPGRIHDCCCNE